MMVYHASGQSAKLPPAACEGPFEMNVRGDNEN